MLQVKLYSACLVLLFTSIHSVFAENDGWYTEGDLVPTTRIKINMVNTLDFDRTDCPVVITRHQMPVKDLHEMRTIVVDPSLTPTDDPTKEMFIKGVCLSAPHNQKEEATQIAERAWETTYKAQVEDKYINN